MIPLFEKDGFLICFEAEEETVGMRRHFIKECGWSESQYRAIKDFAWFSAKVSAWKDGKELAVDYLGCCCYETEEAFYTRHKDEYFADMVASVVQQAKEVAP